MTPKEIIAELAAEHMPRPAHNMFAHEIIRTLKAAGYVIVSEARTRPLSWNRTAPFPEGVDFKAEAVEKLREQITPEMISFETTPCDQFRPEIHRAILRVQ